MIFDDMAKHEIYSGINDRFGRAFDFLLQSQREPKPKGTYVIEKDSVYAVVDTYNTRDEYLQESESHIKYLDIQYIYYGSEKIGIGNKTSMQAVSTYSPENDVVYYAGIPENWLIMTPGKFAVFFPEEIHMPGINAGVLSREVGKIVVKIRISP